MSADEAALIRLRKEKRGEAEPQDLSDNLIVQLAPKAIRLRDKEHCKFVTTPASYVAARRARCIIFVLLRHGRLAARSATSTQFPSAGFITAKSIATATRRHGGPQSALIRFQSR